MCSLVARPNVIDILTILHHTLNFDEAEKNMILLKLKDDLELKMVFYETK